MSALQFELISNQAVALCGAAYFVALLMNLAWWGVHPEGVERRCHGGSGC